MKRICILLNGRIKHDSRVIKIINTLSANSYVDLFYINGNINEDKKMFNHNVQLYSFYHPINFLQLVFRHSLFFYEFNFFYKKIKETRKVYDVVYCNDLPTLNVGYKYKKKYGARLIYDSHEIYIETVNQFYTKKKNLFKNTLFEISIRFMKISGRIFEKKVVKYVDALITVNSSIANYFEEKYKIKNVEFIMNIPILKKETMWNRNLKKELNYLESDFIVIYQGILNNGRGLLPLVNAFKFLPNKFKLLVLGEGILYDDILETVSVLGLESQVKLMGRVPITVLHNYTKIASLGVNLLEAYNLSTYLALPNKLFEYIHAEIPVLCSKTKESIEIVNKYEIGFLTGLSPKEISQAIEECSTLDLSKYKKNCNIAKSRLNWQAQEDMLRRIVLE